MEQDIHKLIAGIGDLQGHGEISVPAPTLRALVAAAQAGEMLRWNRLNQVPELAPADELVLQIGVAISALSARGRLPALRAKQWEAREDARKALAERIAESLLSGFVFARRLGPIVSNGY